MQLFIQVRDGQPYEHPIFEDNMRALFPALDLDNLPSGFAKFTRNPAPVLGAYEVYEGVTYEADGDGFADVHHVRQMTDDEKTAKQTLVKESWKPNGPASWVFDEPTCCFMPPVFPPNDGKTYDWDEANLTWVEVQ